MWSLIILVGYVGWKLQPTNLLENNEARIVVEIQKGEIRACILCVYVYVCVYVWIDESAAFYLHFLYRFVVARRKGNCFHRNFYSTCIYIYIYILSFLLPRFSEGSDLIKIFYALLIYWHETPYSSKYNIHFTKMPSDEKKKGEEERVRGITPRGIPSRRISESRYWINAN